MGVIQQGMWVLLTLSALVCGFGSLGGLGVACTVNVRGRNLVLPFGIAEHLPLCQSTLEWAPYAPYLDRNPFAVELLLDWIHSGVVPTAQADVVTLLQEASFFEVPELVDILKPRVVTVEAFVQFLTTMYPETVHLQLCGDVPMTAYSYKCAACGRYWNAGTAGRKKAVGGGWRCPGCVK